MDRESMILWFSGTVNGVFKECSWLGDNFGMNKVERKLLIDSGVG